MLLDAFNHNRRLNTWRLVTNGEIKYEYECLLFYKIRNRERMGF